MKDAFNKITVAAIKHQHEPRCVVATCSRPRSSRSIKYQLTIAKLPRAKNLDDVEPEDTSINETLVNDLAGGPCRRA